TPARTSLPDPPSAYCIALRSFGGDPFLALPQVLVRHAQGEEDDREHARETGEERACPVAAGEHRERERGDEGDPHGGADPLPRLHDPAGGTRVLKRHIGEGEGLV